MPLRPLLACAMLGLWAAPADARETIGIYKSWGAFRDAAPPRCFAIAEPVRRPAGSGWRPFASVATWPGQNVRAQLNIRLSRRKLPGAAVFLAVGDHRFRLVAAAADAWARNPRQDGAIVAAMRSASSMSVETRGRDGRGFADVYPLRGAATAIDAATLACTRPR